MKNQTNNLHPTESLLLSRSDKEQLTGQRARVIWLVGLSGSGKTTLANALDRHLTAAGRFVTVLDGDNVRTGLNANLGFSDEDRAENLRRVAEVAKLFVRAGIIVINAFITPREAHRQLIREILGEDLLEVFVSCPWEECARRDVKGLYAKAAAGGVNQFTGKDSLFEEPENPDLVLDTTTESAGASLARLIAFVEPRIQRTTPSEGSI